MKDTIKHTYLAADFGGGSGRIIAGFLLNGRLELEEIYRFSNRQVKLGNHIYWDFPALFEDMKTGLKLAAQKGYAKFTDFSIPKITRKNARFLETSWIR